MSYRAFKRLLGETSLERKCRFLFGSGVVLLIFLSFSLYAYQTEHLAYEQTVTTCRSLVAPILAQHHLPLIKNDPQYAGFLKNQDSVDASAKVDPQLVLLLKQINSLDQVVLKDSGKEYQYHFL